jgi:hypothetical protein
MSQSVAAENPGSLDEGTQKEVSDSQSIEDADVIPSSQPGNDVPTNSEDC